MAETQGPTGKGAAKKQWYPMFVGVGIAVGVAIGMLLDNLAMGIGIGLALGVVADGLVFASVKKHNDAAASESSD